MKYFLLFAFCTSLSCVQAGVIHVGRNQPYQKIKDALEKSTSGDTVFVHEGLYREGNIIISKPLTLIGLNYPVLDGEKKTEVVSVKAPYTTIKGFRVIRSNIASLEDPCGIKVYNTKYVQILENQLDDNFFGIYLQKSTNCIVKNNIITAYGKGEQESGNGIHCWRSDTLQILGNQISGCRDGIYFEFVSHSVIWGNTSTRNIRYGLHFMFSNDDMYLANTFKNNGAGVAVMFSKRVSMFNNNFVENWGDAAYGLLLKEISDGIISGNKFTNNTSGIFMEGASRMQIEKNTFAHNGWGMKIQASCLDNYITRNNFYSNTFDASTNGTLVANKFEENYWDKYEGYDLNRDGIGDVHFHPLSVFSMIIEKYPPAMILFRSFMVTLLDRSEKLIPSLTPDAFVDEKPLMKPLKL
jgi:nitrous oxidase accessory protein